MLGKGKVALSKQRTLRDVGFNVIEIKEYSATEIFQSLQHLIIRQKSAPIIPGFDAVGDKGN